MEVDYGNPLAGASSNSAHMRFIAGADSPIDHRLLSILVSSSPRTMGRSLLLDPVGMGLSFEKQVPLRTPGKSHIPIQ